MNFGGDFDDNERQFTVDGIEFYTIDETMAEEIKNYYEESKRYYTLTVKPVLSIFKGDKHRLQESIQYLLDDVRGQIHYIRFEKENTKSLHAHLLIRCPYIANKSLIRCTGYHTNFTIIRKKNENESIQNFQRYLQKELSDSDQFAECNGNAFEGLCD